MARRSKSSSDAQPVPPQRCTSHIKDDAAADLVQITYAQHYPQAGESSAQATTHLSTTRRRPALPITEGGDHSSVTTTGGEQVASETELRGRINLALSLLSHRPHHADDDDLVRLVTAALQGSDIEQLRHADAE
jgi:hypothetical protein